MAMTGLSNSTMASLGSSVELECNAKMFGVILA